jgi:uncharacterized protein
MTDVRGALATGARSVRGTAFPFRIDPATGGVGQASGEEKVRQDLQALLATRLGERPLQRTFGTRAAALVHEPIDDVLIDLAVRQIEESVLLWEPRVTLMSVDAEREPDLGEVRLVLTYRLVPEQTAGRLVVPLI